MSDVSKQTYSAFELAINPPYKMEVKIDMPLLREAAGSGAFMYQLSSYIKKAQASESRVINKVNIMYPQKDPNIFPEYKDSARSYVVSMRNYLRNKGFPYEVKFRDDIYETVGLDRSGRHSLAHDLTGCQLYTMPEQEIKPEGIFAGEYFVLMDWVVDKGGTFTNMTDFVEHNGGKVIAVMPHKITARIGSSRDYYSLQQQELSGMDIWASPMHLKPRRVKNTTLPVEFIEKGHNNKNLKCLAAAFSASAKRDDGADITPGKCLRDFEKALNRHGKSVFSLTNVETVDIACKLGGDKNESYLRLVKSLNNVEPKPHVKTPPYSPLLRA